MSSPSQAEAELVQRLYARDDTAMTEFYARYGKLLYRVIHLMVPTAEAAEDILQESLVKIWLAFAHYDAERGRLYTWAVNICRHHAIDHLRAARSRGASRTTGLENTPAAYRVPGPALVPEHVDVRASLRWLRPSYRQVVELQYFQGFTQEEMAAHLDMPLGTVKTRCRQALRQLARLHRDLSAR
ncbi:RNA polymerase sigma factor [uncultured Hymenobacter sp.]|uniref:RNA polymerase sigma factor n=1 Tax=uncultured Hymenobacter sp. TaxID=170016 RepID=UPI0035CA9B19